MGWVESKSVRVLGPEFADSFVGCEALSGHAWEQLELPRYASDGRLLALCGAPSLIHFAHFFAIHDTAII
jgi:hypothetical protein